MHYRPNVCSYRVSRTTSNTVTVAYQVHEGYRTCCSRTWFGCWNTCTRYRFVHNNLRLHGWTHKASWYRIKVGLTWALQICKNVHQSSVNPGWTCVTLLSVSGTLSKERMKFVHSRPPKGNVLSFFYEMLISYKMVERWGVSDEYSKNISPQRIFLCLCFTRVAWLSYETVCWTIR